ncbi:hypothetical protein ACWDCB_40380 [Streptomyces sp. NPDC001178]
MSLSLPVIAGLGRALFTAANTAAGIFKKPRRFRVFNPEMVTQVQRSLVTEEVTSAIERIHRDRRDTIHELLLDAKYIRSREALASKFTGLMPLVEEARISARNRGKATEETDLSILAAAIYIGIGVDGWSAARRLNDAEFAFQRVQRAIPPAPSPATGSYLQWAARHDPSILLEAAPPGQWFPVVPISQLVLDVSGVLHAALPSEF